LGVRNAFTRVNESPTIAVTFDLMHLQHRIGEATAPSIALCIGFEQRRVNGLNACPTSKRATEFRALAHVDDGEQGDLAHAATLAFGLIAAIMRSSSCVKGGVKLSATAFLNAAGVGSLIISLAIDGPHNWRMFT
jgi:hypothetical protein